MRRQHLGFTLIELTITLAIITTLAGVAGPAMAGFIEHQRATATATSLTTHMQLARMAAVSRNRRAVLCPTSDGNSCAAGTDWSTGWMLFVDDDGNRRPDHNDDILRVDLQPTSTHLRVVSTTGRQQLRYLPDGSSAGSNLTVSICNHAGALLGQVIVNNMGRPRSEHPKTATPCPA
jgi:type IV fimbrial biogenesis protein FimT